MSCDHVGPNELIAMADEDLRKRGHVPASGMKFRYAENHDGFFAAAITEIERRDDVWLVTRIDRLKEPLPEDETGFRQIG